jgi:hypothetical protein
MGTNDPGGRPGFAVSMSDAGVRYTRVNAGVSRPGRQERYTTRVGMAAIVTATTRSVNAPETGG